MQQLHIQVSAASHTGRRDNNEDSYLVEPELDLFAVADGMGGYEGGEVASGLAVSRLRDAMRGSARGGSQDGTRTRLRSKQRLLSAFDAAGAAVSEARRGVLAHMGSTLSVLLLSGQDALIAHVGDSRVYRLRAGKLERLTCDHNLAGELQRAGVQVAKDNGMEHMLTRALGTQHATPDLLRVALRAGDQLLLCSDGLHGVLDEGVIAQVMAQWPTELAADELVHLAYESGSTDNITAVVLALEAAPPRALERRAPVADQRPEAPAERPSCEPPA